MGINGSKSLNVQGRGCELWYRHEMTDTTIDKGNNMKLLRLVSTLVLLVGCAGEDPYTEPVDAGSEKVFRDPTDLPIPPYRDGGTTMRKDSNEQGETETD